MLNYILESLKYAWPSIVVGIIGAFLAWVGGKLYSNASQIVDTKLGKVEEKFEDYVKKDDYKEDTLDLKETLKIMSVDIKELLKAK